MRRQLRPDQLDQFGFGDLGSPGLTDYDGDDPLPQIGVGDTDHRNFGHRRVPEDGGLDLAGADSESTGFDQVDGFAADDSVEPTLVDDGDVTGLEVAVLRPGLGGLRPDGSSSRRKASAHVPVGRPILSPSCGTSLPFSSRRRVSTPRSGTPTHPGRRSPSKRVLRVSIVSLMP